MSFDYGEIAGIADEMLKEFGSPATLTSKEPSGTYDPDTATFPEVETTVNCTACVFPINQKLVDGTTIQATDEVAYLSAVGIDPPTPAQTLTWQGTGYTILRAENLAPAGTSVLYTLIVRR